MHCLKCNGDSGKSKFCRKCRSVKENAWALVSQNKRKMLILLDWDWLSPNGFEKFQLYCDNILKNGRVLMEYKLMDTQRTFNNILKK